MTHRTRSLIAISVSALFAVTMLSGCMPESGAAPTSASSRSPSFTGEPSPIESERPQTPTPSATAAAEIPTDCRTILNDAVLAELGSTPLNDPVFGPSGVLPDGSLTCVWAFPAADTTGLTTTITRVARGPGLDMLNQLVVDDGFTCYTPSGGTRCEKTWQNTTYPVTDGRTLFWRDDILIDTRWSNLAPAGYTDAIVTSIFG